ncbi:MAG: CDP-glucose 4,6-dehydratase [Planctomycetota bacterium]
MSETPLDRAFRDRSVLVTGHTGFKGGWLCTWLKMLGARVTGVALPPEAGRPSLFETAGVAQGLTSIMQDIRDLPGLLEVFSRHEPEIVLHLAAQALVRRSYADPVETHGTNVMGTVHVLEAIRRTPSVRTAVVISSDKCYENREIPGHAYSEKDPMGGHDPYSASKGATELVTASYRSSFFPPADHATHGVALASARAGNVIGGGDWAEDRLIPDCIRALMSDTPIPIRNPRSVRPWQHVLEPLSGYLWLAARLAEEPVALAGPWNFGPRPEGEATVGEVADRVVAAWGEGSVEDLSDRQSDAPHEATWLKLDCAKAAAELAWEPVLPLEDSIRATVDWYSAVVRDPGIDGGELTRRQIGEYTRAARGASRPWSQAG